MRRETKINIILVALFVIIAAGLYFIVFELGGVSLSPDETAVRGHPVQNRSGRPEVGKPAPDFTVQTMGGRKFTLSQMKGKVVFLNFFATWCGPCLMEIKDLDALNEQFKNQDFVMLAVSSENGFQQSLPGFRSRFKKPPLFAFDSGGGIINAYGLVGFPESYLIDKRGYVVKRYIGPYQWTHPHFISMVQDLLNK